MPKSNNDQMATVGMDHSQIISGGLTIMNEINIIERSDDILVHTVGKQIYTTISAMQQMKNFNMRTYILAIISYRFASTINTIWHRITHTSLAWEDGAKVMPIYISRKRVL